MSNSGKKHTHKHPAKSRKVKHLVYHIIGLTILIVVLVVWHEKELTISACVLKLVEITCDVAGDRLFDFWS